MAQVTVERKLNIPIEELWPVVADFSRSPSPSMTVTIVEQGDAANGGVGCERLVREGRSGYHEKLVAVEPLRAYTYVMLSGAPVKDYTGRVELVAEGDGTVIRWSSSYKPGIPGTGWLVNRINRKKYAGFIDELEKAFAH
jgi:hypothetical protein